MHKHILQSYYSEVHADEKTISNLKTLNPKTVLDPPKAEPESDGKNFKTDTFGFTDIIDPNFSDAYATMTEQNMR